MILIDTSCWVEYFRPSGGEVSGEVERLVRCDEAAICGVILAELLQGTRTEGEYSGLRTALGAVEWVRVGDRTFERAGRIAFDLRRAGTTVPLTDCIIAACAESAGMQILTLDFHFQEIEKVSSLQLVEL